MSADRYWRWWPLVASLLNVALMAAVGYGVVCALLGGCSLKDHGFGPRYVVRDTVVVHDTVYVQPPPRHRRWSLSDSAPERVEPVFRAYRARYLVGAR